MAVFLGFKIDRTQRNPFAPSSITLRFAIASSQKMLEVPASFAQVVNSIKGASADVSDNGIEHVLYEWGDAIQVNMKDRNVRYIVTGNILQAFNRYRGKLISYSTIDGKTEKGILLPEAFELEKVIGKNVEVPVSKALKLFKSLTQGKDINTSHGITFFRVADNMFKMVVSGSIREGGEVFLNLKVIKLTFENNFSKTGNNMVAHVMIDDLQEMLNVLEDELGVSVDMSQQQIDNVGLIDRPIRPRVKIQAPDKESDEPAKESHRERAMALKIKLKLLALKKRRAS